MAASSGHGNCASFMTQADALLRKNLAFQKRNVKQNITLIFFPALLCCLIISIQHAIESQLSNSKYRCGCQCIDVDNRGTCRTACGMEYSSTLRQASACPIPRPRQWPALMQIPAPQYRAMKTELHGFEHLPDKSCKIDQTCPAVSLFTGQNKSIANSLMSQIYVNEFPQNGNDLLNIVPLSYIGTDSSPGFNNFVENAFMSRSPLEMVLPYCPMDFNVSMPTAFRRTKEVRCVQSIYVWRENSAAMNNELFQGYRKGNPAKESYEYAYAYDFLNTNRRNFNVTIWYNSTYKGLASNSRLLRVPRPVNMISNAFIRSFGGKRIRILLSFVKEMPKAGNGISVQLSSIIGPLLYAWVIQLLIPVFLTSLVYEKQQKLRTMMKLHGLRDGPYWMITYSYFLFISTLYMIWFAAFGYIIGLNIFRLNSYAIQCTFYFLYLNLQITLAFLGSYGFSDVKTATVVSYMYVFGSGLLGEFLFKFYLEDTSFSSRHVMIMELFPGFSLYQGLYELQQYSLSGEYQGSTGISWKILAGQKNEMRRTLVIISSEWLILLCIAYMLEQAVPSGNAIRTNTQFALKRLLKRTAQKPITSEVPCSTIIIDGEVSDLHEERYKVEQLLLQPRIIHPIVCNNLKKVYSGKDGIANKSAVDSFYLTVSRGECFGLLGPSGSGKTTFINMMTGFLLPTSGTAFIDNMDIRSAMDQIQTKIGVCPQQDVIWETLTGREHLLFYGRLRNLKGSALKKAVEKSLRSFKLYGSNVGDKLTGAYSGGMKRRLSVAISIIGNTQVVFLDEPTTGLDIESRSNLWEVVREAKSDRAIILTTHSMEEAEYLCDRLGILVNGRLQCLGNSNELKTRYGRSHLFTMSVNPLYKENVERMVSNLSPSAVKVYDVGGTQKFQLPKQEVRISDIFAAVDSFKREFPIYGFGLSASSLEDVFTNVVDEAFW